MTILDLLNDEQVFAIDANADGTYEVYEKCDTHYAVTLTRDQMVELAQEILAFVGMPNALAQ